MKTTIINLSQKFNISKFEQLHNGSHCYYKMDKIIQDMNDEIGDFVLEHKNGDCRDYYYRWSYYSKIQRRLCFSVCVDKNGDMWLSIENFSFSEKTQNLIKTDALGEALEMARTIINGFEKYGFLLIRVDEQI